MSHPSDPAAPKPDPELRLESGQSVVLRPADFVAQGGEARVFARGPRAFKVFDTARPDLGRRRDALQSVDHRRAVVPDALLLGPVGEPRGYVMARVPRGVSWARAATASFWQRSGMKASHAWAMVADLFDIVRAAHEAGMVIADLSPNNVLCGPDLDTAFVIDTDSWQTPTDPATAITPTLVDPRCSGPVFSPASDWFAFAVTSFELLVGIHPFRGKHPALTDLAARMKAGVSVFDPQVSMPGCCRPLQSLPPDYAKWCRSVLEGGLREPPPGLRRRKALPADRTRIVAVLQVGTRRVQVHAPDTAGEFRLFERTARGAAMPLPGRFRADELVAHGGRVFVRRSGQIDELLVRSVGQRLVASLRPRGKVLPGSSQLFGSVVLWTVLGQAWALVLQAERTHPVRVPELDRMTPIDATYHGGWLEAVAERGGRRHAIRLPLADAGRLGGPERPERSTSPRDGPGRTYDPGAGRAEDGRAFGGSPSFAPFAVD